MVVVCDKLVTVQVQLQTMTKLIQTDHDFVHLSSKINCLSPYLDRRAFNFDAGAFLYTYMQTSTSTLHAARIFYAEHIDKEQHGRWISHKTVITS